jgi:hypothetical protein
LHLAVRQHFPGDRADEGSEDQPWQAQEDAKNRANQRANYG